MTIEVHGDRYGDRAIGKPKTLTMRDARDPAVAVRLAKQLLQSGAWRTVPKTGDDTDKALYLLRSRLPAALQVLPRLAVAAMTRNPPSPGCHWCVAAMLAGLTFGEEVEPERNEHTLAFLGTPCSRCRHRHASDAAVTAAVEQYTTLVAAGVPPATAARARTPQAARWLLAAAQRRAPTRPPAPTGTLWPADRRQPPAVTAALRASRPHKAPVPAYYRPFTPAELAARHAQAEAEGRERQRQVEAAEAATRQADAAIVAAWQQGRRR